MKNRKLWLAIGCLFLAAAIGVLIWSLTRPKTETKPEATAPETVGETVQTEAAKDVLEQIKERGSLIIAMEGVWQPWTYHDADGKLTGFDVEVGNLLAEGLGVKAEFVETAWDGILAGVDSGRFDIACNGVGYTEKRQESYNFSEVYIYSQMALVVREDDEEIKSLEDLKGKKTANSPNSTYATVAEKAGAEVTYVDTLGETMSLLTDGRINATLNDKDSVESYMSEHPEAKIRIALTVAGEPVAVPMKKGPETDSLKAEIDRIFQEARNNGKLAELSIKYFGVDLTKPLD